ncbi:TerC family protein [Pseudalkalibacillus decolorationis]|uniref:TerC family protein n=1 Tax=Pseudalkalibacillus decolorationis TaxID=163879 RepID=UPI0021480DC0|nr:TerC family protein [Pseudalkalibacillus decolorationis]
MIFDSEFLVALLSIIAIDIVLGGDNAIVIALASRNLPDHQRNKAIFIGTGLAIAVRVLLTIVAVYLLKIPFLMLIGGLLLVYIAYNLLADDNHDADIKGGTTLVEAIRTIVVADVVMGVDNVLAIAGAAHGNILLVIIGLLVSVPIIIWGSKLILHFMEKYPSIIYIGAAILGFTSAGMIMEEEVVHNWIGDNFGLKLLIYIVVIGGILLAGWFTKRSKARPKNV